MPEHKGPILILYDYTTQEELRRKKFATSRDAVLLRGYLKAAGIQEQDCLFTSVLKRVVRKGDISPYLHSNAFAKKQKLTPYKDLHPKQELLDDLANLEELIANTKPRLIIAAGPLSLWSMTETEYKIKSEKGFKKPTGDLAYRGSQLYSTHGIPLLPLVDMYSLEAIKERTYRTRTDLTVRYKKFLNNEWDDIDRNFIIRPTLKDVTDFFQHIKTLAAKGPIPLAADIETRNYLIACIGFAWSSTDAICIPMMIQSRTTDATYTTSYWTPEEEAIIQAGIRDIFSNSNIKIVGQNFLFDAQYIATEFLTIPKISGDTMVAQHVIFPGTELGLDVLSSLYCHYHRYWKDDGKTWQKTMDENNLWIYNCRDCVVTFEAHEVLLGLIKNYNLEEQYDYQIKALVPILKIMLKGINIDREVKSRVITETLEKMKPYQEFLDVIIPEDLYSKDPKKSSWYTSPQQQRTVFCEVFGLRPFYSKKLRRYTMDETGLADMKKQEPLLAPIVDAIAALKKLQTFRTFTEMQLSKDGRVRTSVMPTTSTFRWKSKEDVYGSGGNLQNLPKGTEKD